MANDPRLVYWDANVAQSYIEGVADRLPVLDAQLEQSTSAQHGLKLLTSTLSIVEVAYAAQEKEQRMLDPQIEDKINALWEDPRAIQLVEVYEQITRDARTLMRQALVHGWSLKPHDAIHLATARRLGVVEFHTYDKPLTKYRAVVGFLIMEPYTDQPRLLDLPPEQDDPASSTPPRLDTIEFEPR